LRSLLPFLSKDADFIGTKTEAAQVAQQTGWHLSPPLFGGGPVEAVLSFPDYYEQEPEEGATFTRAMHSLTSGIIQEIVHVVDTSTVKLADDVGGASGTLLHDLMAGNPQLQGMVVDLPDVVRSAETAAVALGLAGRFRAVASDFFDYIPEADLYLLKYILHDWNDADAVRILKRCREAMRPEGRVIVIERLLGNIGQSRLAPLADLNMMVLLTVQERTLGELRQLGQNSPSLRIRV
jgi:O-methyltransferase domain